MKHGTVVAAFLEADLVRQLSGSKGCANAESRACHRIRRSDAKTTVLAADLAVDATGHRPDRLMLPHHSVVQPCADPKMG